MTTLLEELLDELGRIAAMVESFADGQFVPKQVPFSIQINRDSSGSQRDARARFADAYTAAQKNVMAPSRAVDFVFDMSLVYSCSLFEKYLVQLLCKLFTIQPKMLLPNKGTKQTEIASRKIDYRAIIEAAENNKPAIELIIEEELRRFSYLSCREQLSLLRNRYGFKHLTNEYDASVTHFVLARNCIVHNHSVVESRLSEASRGFFREGTRLHVEPHLCVTSHYDLLLYFGSH